MPDSLNRPKLWLIEISFMRPLLLLLLVSYHAFAPYCGAWNKPDCIGDVEAYKWVANFSRAFRLEAFVFVSGYIFTFQLLAKNKFSSLSELAVSKLNRLIIPCIFFGIIYCLLFGFNGNGLISNAISIVFGVGHLWYLPCLFWLFILQYVLVKVLHIHQSDNRLRVPFYFAIAFLPALSILPIPMQLNKACYYLLFFYGGGIFYQYKDEIANRVTSLKVILGWLCFILVVFFFFTIIESNKESLACCASIVSKSFYSVSNTYLKVIMAIIGIVCLYCTSVLYCRSHSISKVMLEIGTCGYGVYIFHQFILTWLYDYSSLPCKLGTYCLPWASLLITVILSVALTFLVRKTKVGRKYL